MAETAQDSTVPLRGGDDKLKDEDLEDGMLCALTLFICRAQLIAIHKAQGFTPMQWNIHRFTASRKEPSYKKPAYSTSPTWIPANASRCGRLLSKHPTADATLCTLLSSDDCWRLRSKHV